MQRYRGHPVLEDLNVFRAPGEGSALVFVCKNGDTHYLEPGDLAQFMRFAECGSFAELGNEEPAVIEEDQPLGPLAAFRNLGLLRHEAKGQ